MDRKTLANRLELPLLLLIACSLPLPLAAQVPVDTSGNPLSAYDEGEYASKGIAGADIEDLTSFSASELEELVGPVALYPDDLLAIVLPASTYPLQIVQAARFLEALETDDTLTPDEEWDESVVALLNYPEVVRMLDEDIDWTWRLGEAVISQQAEVIAAVEVFRDRAYAAGNLESDEYQTVSNDDGVIEIAPADEEVIYVPYYEPEEVIVYQREPVYAYYPQPRPVYYYPYPVDYAFPSRYFWGVTTAFTIGWPSHYLHVYHPSYWGHPYYGRFYYGHYYRQPSISVYNTWYVNNHYRHTGNRHRDGDYWQPRDRHRGARPGTRDVRNRHYPPEGGERHAGRRSQAGVADSYRSTADRTRVDRGNRRSERRDAVAGNVNRRDPATTAIRFRERPATTTNQARRAPVADARQDRTPGARGAVSFRPNNDRPSAARSEPSARVTRTAAPGRQEARSRGNRAPVATPAISRSSAPRQSPPRGNAVRKAAPHPPAHRGTQTTGRNAAPPPRAEQARARQSQAAPRQNHASAAANSKPARNSAAKPERRQKAPAAGRQRRHN